MDVLSDILGSLRLTGGVILDAHARGDWCVRSQLQPEDTAGMFPHSGLLIAYHYIRSGHLRATVDGGATVEAHPGSILLLPRNDPHRLYTKPTDDPVDSHAFVKAGLDGGLARFELGTEGEPAEFYCGFMGVASDHHPLLDSLPAILVVDQRDAADDAWLQGNLHFLNAEQKAPETIARIAELLFSHAVRAYVADLPEGEGGWLAGLRDPAVARALAVIHKCYADDLDVEGLAREAGVSRSVLGERFVELLGEPPMRYCARWRMRVAANMLRDGKDNSASVAYSVGFNSEAAFNRAFKREFGEPPAAWRRQFEQRARVARERERRHQLPEQVIRYCQAPDGTRLAFSALGRGPPLVKTANWLNHLEHDFDSPLWRHWLRLFSDQRCFVRYDERATGLSEWNPPALSFDSFVDDLASVVDCSHFEQFDLLGISQGAAVAIAYAVKHPERVRRLLLCGGYARGWKVRANPEEVKRREAMLTLTELGWGADNPAFRHMFTSLYIPGASPAQSAWFDEMQRLSASPANAVRLQRLLSELNVEDLLAKVSVPTLVYHARRDGVVPFAEGEFMAAGIPGATFCPLDSANHILLESEPAWAEFAEGARAFLAP